MQVTSCKEVQARLAGDKLRWTGGVKIGLAAAFLRCLEQLHTNLRAVRLPLLVRSSLLPCLTVLLQVLHGENDSLCQPAGSALLVREARWAVSSSFLNTNPCYRSADKQLKLYPGAGHHLILETRELRTRVTSDILAWLNSRIGQAGGEAVTDL